MARLIFMGTPGFAVPILESLIQCHQVVALVTQPDQLGGRGRKQLLPPPTKEVALARGIPVLQPPRLNRPLVVAALKELRPGAIIVAAFGQILRRSVLELAPRGCINVHASLLPRYRGAAPIAAAILAGEAETGVTIMRMDEGIDTGDILALRALPIAPADTTATLTVRLARLGAELLIETLPGWLRGEIAPQPQDEALASYAPQIDKEDGRINWDRPAAQIVRLIRAYDPWPGAYTIYNGALLKILRARALPDWRGSSPPGQVVRLRESVAVATGQGILLLDEIQPAGKRAMTAQAYVSGQREFVGATLGE
jgi:methionyl-tRNA formyltransferase